MRVAIVGLGFVGQHMLKIFPDALQIDPPKRTPKGYGATESCDLAIVCVPTPMRADGSCDTSIVESVVPQLKATVILVRSTVTPGTCDRIAEASGQRIVFAPEYMGESRYWTPAQFPQPRDPIGHGFMIIGGNDLDCSYVADIFLPILGPCTRFRFVRRKEAELIKYAENAFFALKVTFATQLRRICQASGVNYHRVREGWLDDPRVGAMHSAAFSDAPGFGGKCLPKDTAALAEYSRAIGIAPILLDAVLEQNQREQRSLPDGL